MQVIFVCSLLSHEQMLGTEYSYPEWSIEIGYALTASSIMCIPLYICYKFIVTPGSIVQVNFIVAHSPKFKQTLTHDILFIYIFITKLYIYKIVFPLL